MGIFKDTNNTYLKRYNIPNKIIDDFETILILHDENEKSPKININEYDNVICGQFAYEHPDKLKPFNDWKRSGITKELKPKFLKKIDLIVADQRKVYYDFLKLDRTHIYDFSISFITSGNIDWVNQNFLVLDDETRRRCYYLQILKETKLIVHTGHNEQYDKWVKLFIYKKRSPILDIKQTVDDKSFEHHMEHTYLDSIFHD